MHPGRPVTSTYPGILLCFLKSPSIFLFTRWDTRKITNTNSTEGEQMIVAILPLQVWRHLLCELHWLPGLLTSKSPQALQLPPPKRHIRAFQVSQASLICCQCWELLGVYPLLEDPFSPPRDGIHPVGSWKRRMLLTECDLFPLLQSQDEISVLELGWEQQAQIKASVSCKCSPASCHTQDKAKHIHSAPTIQLRSVPLRQSSQPVS